MVRWGMLLMASRGTDKFGFRLGMKRARGAELYERGATQAEITTAVGYPLYNMLKDAVQRGHRVVREGDRFWLRHASATDNIEADVEEIRNRSDLTETERATLIQARRGQGRYRAQVMRAEEIIEQSGPLLEAVEIVAAVGQGLPLRLRRQHVRCAPESCRLVASRARRP
jgi:hypothetical protein